MKYEVKKWACFALCVTLIFSLSACSSAGASGREPEDTVLAQIIGVDMDGQGVIVAAAGYAGEEETVVETARGATLEEAFAALPAAGEKYFSLTNVAHVLVGDGVNVKAVLDYVVDDPDMSYMAKVWAVNGFAGGLMDDMKEGGLGRFTVLERSVPETVTVKTALAELLSGGGTALPALAVREDGLEHVGKIYFEVR